MRADVVNDPIADTGFDAAFDLVRKLRDPEFRAYLGRLGYRSGSRTPIVMAVRLDPIWDILAKVRLASEGGHNQVLVVVANAEVPFGLDGFMVNVAAPPLSDTESSDL